MTTQPTTSKRWRPRFSVRTLVILVTLVCCYAACWGPTKTRGVEDVPRRAFRGTIGLSSGNAGEDAAMNERFYQSFNASPALPLVVGVNWEYQGPPTRRIDVRKPHLLAKFDRAADGEHDT